MKRKTHIARRGWLTAEGTTKTEAKSRLESMIDWSCSAETLTVERRFDCLVIVAACATGWQSKAFPISDTKHGKEITCFTQEAPRDYAAVLQSARVHAAQLAWTQETEDEAHVLAAGLLSEKSNELRRWIRFQRGYIANKACGMTDGEAHEKACFAA